MSWLENLIQKTTSSISGTTKHEIPEGVWTKCSACDQVLYRAELERNLNVCPKSMIFPIILYFYFNYACKYKGFL